MMDVSEALWGLCGDLNALRLTQYNLVSAHCVFLQTHHILQVLRRVADTAKTHPLSVLDVETLLAMRLFVNDELRGGAARVAKRCVVPHHMLAVLPSLLDDASNAVCAHIDSLLRATARSTWPRRAGPESE